MNRELFKHLSEEHSLVLLDSELDEIERIVEGVKICTGCGTRSDEILKEGALACCPDNNYVSKDEYILDLERIVESRGKALIQSTKKINELNSLIEKAFKSLNKSRKKKVKYKRKKKNFIKIYLFLL